MEEGVCGAGGKGRKLSTFVKDSFLRFEEGEGEFWSQGGFTGVPGGYWMNFGVERERERVKGPWL